MVGMIFVTLMNCRNLFVMAEQPQTSSSSSSTKTTTSTIHIHIHTTLTPTTMRRTRIKETKSGSTIPFLTSSSSLPFLMRGGAALVNDDSEDEYDIMEDTTDMEDLHLKDQEEYDNEEMDDEEEDIEEIEDIEELDEEKKEKEKVVQLKSSTLEASTRRASIKSNRKQQLQNKAELSKKLSSSNSSSSSGTPITTTFIKNKKKKKKKKQSSSSSSSITNNIPYVIKAFLNPFTVFAMTKGYFVSLFNIDFMQKNSTESLRSTLQEKAKKTSGGISNGRSKGSRKMKPGQAKTLSDLPKLNA